MVRCVGTVGDMSFGNTNNFTSSANRPWSRRRWASHFQTNLLTTLGDWTTDPAVAVTGVAALRRELATLAGPEIDWSDRSTVERLVSAAAQAEAFSMSTANPDREEPCTGARLATSLFSVYLRELRHLQRPQDLATLPARIRESTVQVDTDPEDAANELAFTAAMAVLSSLR